MQVENELRYGFGKNWSEFVKKNFSQERVSSSQKDLLDFLKLDNLVDKTFLDIGCGSGLHSLAAYRSGAKKVVSFDYDINSVNTTKFLREKEGNPTNWEVLQGSVLDKGFMEKLPKSDIVYSWGVLHHTGDMWQAIQNATIPLKETSLFFIALYTWDSQVSPTAEFWLDIKKKYNKASPFGKFLYELWYYNRFCLIPDLRNKTNPLKRFQNYKHDRGMALWTDIKDWLGGWPMEYVKIMDLQKYASEKLDFELLHMTSFKANGEFLFQKRQFLSPYWANVINNQKTIEIKKPFQVWNGKAWSFDFKEAINESDNIQSPMGSPYVLYENDYRLPMGHAAHLEIINYGNGRYSHWGDKLYFSTSDNSDPNTNGRTYVLRRYNHLNN